MPLYRAELIRRKKPLIGPQIHDVSQVLYLPLDLDDGSYARDRSGYSNHGAIYGATRVAGKVGSALSFDGVDDYVEAPTSPSLESPRFSALVWFKVLTLPSDKGEWAEPIQKHDSGINGWCIAMDRANEIKPHTGDGTDWYMASTGVYVERDVWYHVAITFDGAVLKSYVNGDLKVSLPASYSISANPLRLAIPKDWPGERMHGLVDEARVYNRVLSAAEVKLLMHLRGV